MEIDNLLRHDEKTIEYLRGCLRPSGKRPVDREEPDVMDLWLFNYSVDIREGCTLLGEKVDRILAHILGEKSYCFYLLVEGDIDLIQRMQRFLGAPKNVDEADIAANDFDFLSWEIGDDSDTLLSFDFITPKKDQEKKRYLIFVANVRLKDVIESPIPIW